MIGLIRALQNQSRKTAIFLLQDKESGVWYFTVRIFRRLLSMDRHTQKHFIYIDIQRIVAHQCIHKRCHWNLCLSVCIELKKST